MKNPLKLLLVNFRSLSFILIIIVDKYCAIKVVLRDTSKVIEKLNESFPIENIRHLKRIKKLKGQGKMQISYILIKKCRICYSVGE